jgi:hypothetical protein
MSRKSKSRSSDGRKSTGGDNVQVVIRCRPQNKRERKKNEDIIVTTNSKASEVIVQHNQRNNRDDGKRRFTFDHVFGEESTQQEVYNKIVKPVVAELFSS